MLLCGRAQVRWHQPCHPHRFNAPHTSPPNVFHRGEHQHKHQECSTHVSGKDRLHNHRTALHRRYDDGAGNFQQMPWDPNTNDLTWNCSAANFTMAYYSTNASRTVGGWGSNPCNASLPYMCRMQNLQDTPRMTTTSTNATYYFNTTKTTFADAEISCKNNGGHIAGYSSLAEQQEVEAFFIAQGYIIPVFQPVYWYGANTNSTLWPAFTHLYGPLGDLPDPFPEPSTGAPTSAPSSPVFSNWWVAGRCMRLYVYGPSLRDWVWIAAELCSLPAPTGGWLAGCAQEGSA